MPGPAINGGWTVKEYARLERVAPRTVYRWIDNGAVEVRRTPGGGIRVLDSHATPETRKAAAG